MKYRLLKEAALLCLKEEDSLEQFDDNDNVIGYSPYGRTKKDLEAWAEQIGTEDYVSDHDAIQWRVLKMLTIRFPTVEHHFEVPNLMSGEKFGVFKLICSKYNVRMAAVDAVVKMLESEGYKVDEVWKKVEGDWYASKVWYYLEPET